jgi:hypothetical protein
MSQNSDKSFNPTHEAKLEDPIGAPEELTVQKVTPGVDRRTFLMRSALWEVDAGVKWRGLAFNSQGFARRLDSFVADGPLPLSSTFDTGAEMMLNYYLIPKKFELYFRGSFVFGQFRDSNEYGPGIRFYPVKSYRVWLAGEGLRINRCPIGSTISSYSAGFSGWEPLAQLMFTF